MLEIDQDQFHFIKLQWIDNNQILIESEVLNSDKDIHVTKYFKLDLLNK